MAMGALIAKYAARRALHEENARPQHSEIFTGDLTLGPGSLKKSNCCWLHHPILRVNRFEPSSLGLGCASC